MPRRNQRGLPAPCPLQRPDSQVPGGPGPVRGRRVFTLAPFAWQSPGCPLRPHPATRKPTRVRAARPASCLHAPFPRAGLGRRLWGFAPGCWLFLAFADHCSLPGSCRAGRRHNLPLSRVCLWGLRGNLLEKRLLYSSRDPCGAPRGRRAPVAPVTRTHGAGRLGRLCHKGTVPPRPCLGTERGVACRRRGPSPVCGNRLQLPRPDL